MAADAGRLPAGFPIAFGPARLHSAFGTAMHLTRSQQQNSKTLDEFYTEISHYDHPVDREGGKAMLDLIGRLRAIPDERHVYGLTSDYRLCLRAQDTPGAAWSVIISALDNLVEAQRRFGSRSEHIYRMHRTPR